MGAWHIPEAIPTRLPNNSHCGVHLFLTWQAPCQTGVSTTPASQPASQEEAAPSRGGQPNQLFSGCVEQEDRTW